MACFTKCLQLIVGPSFAVILAKKKIPPSLGVGVRKAVKPQIINLGVEGVVATIFVFAPNPNILLPCTWNFLL